MAINAHPCFIAEWRSILAAARKYLAEMPALAVFITSLEEALEDTTISKAQQLDLEAQRRQATQDYHDYVAVGREEVARLQSYVKSAFGQRDERLAEFGIKPAGRRSRKLPEPDRQDGSPGYH